MHNDYYALLGVQRTATADEIKAAYRRLAQRLHPDVSGDAGAEERFKEITRAYQILRDPDQRVRYELEEMERALELSEQEINSVPPMREFVAPAGGVPRADAEAVDAPQGEDARAVQAVRSRARRQVRATAAARCPATTTRSPRRSRSRRRCAAATSC